MLDYLATTQPEPACIIGITGTPGAGKSTLVGELAQRLVRLRADIRVGVLAIDPSSQISGGALLGDRTRIRFPVDEPRLYFRSQASDLDLGGLGRHSYAVCRLMRLLFDFVFVETVGIGQSEIDVRYLADRSYLVLAPLGGDQVQFMKAGIMEIPDAFIVNKCDEGEVADRTYHMLRASLGLARPLDAGQDGSKLTIHRTSATTGRGLDALVAEIAATTRRLERTTERDSYFFRKWVRDCYGLTGLRALQGAQPTLAALAQQGYEAAQGAFEPYYRAWLQRGEDGALGNWR